MGALGIAGAGGAADANGAKPCAAATEHSQNHATQEPTRELQSHVVRLTDRATITEVGKSGKPSRAPREREPVSVEDDSSRRSSSSQDEYFTMSSPLPSLSRTSTLRAELTLQAALQIPDARALTAGARLLSRRLLSLRSLRRANERFGLSHAELPRTTFSASGAEHVVARRAEQTRARAPR